jgi:undecaprenyl-diphosphatase
VVREFSRTGEHGILWYALCAAGAIARPERREDFKRAAVTVALSFGANQAVKFAVRRPRPELPGLPPLVKTMSNRSYPSAHATTCGAAAVALGSLVPRRPLYALAGSMALTRPYLGVHYPSDSLAGFALGAAVAELRA